ncbi:MAG: hypothetical protein ACE5HS_10755 [bacterium]
MSNCTKCHSLGGGATADKCLECHVEIQQFFTEKKGFHFLVKEKENGNCFECHNEHNGRNFQLIFWPKGRDKFDHERTGFVLKGKHRELKCKDCHQSKNIVHDPRKLNKEVEINKTYLGLGQACLNCHFDEHQGQLARDCLQCHNNQSWKPAAKFSHDRTKFRLVGQHQKVACSKCHPVHKIAKARITNPEKRTFVKFIGLQFGNCTPCHRDPHLEKFGQNCQKCHDTFGWNRIIAEGFNHSLTRFPLVGLHQQVPCDKCHVGGKITNKLKFEECRFCHKDIHFGQFADRKDRGRCKSCHDVFGFQPAHYDVTEHARSAYPLTGAHLAVPCIFCHVIEDRGTVRERRKYQFANTNCQGCHWDVHKGQFAAQIQGGGCESCHQTDSWQNTRFDHNASRFPLLGKHAEKACRQCHKTVDVGLAGERLLFKPMDLACGSCHKDIHLGQFILSRPPKTCDKCHRPIGWPKLIFDHDRDALFKLKGGHEKVPCAECHKLEQSSSTLVVRYKPLDKRCISCHGKK